MGSITPGRSMEGAVEHFGVKGEGDLELEIKPSQHLVRNRQLFLLM